MPTGIEIQKRFDDLKADLSAQALAENVAKVVQISHRLPNNQLQTFQISSDRAGVLDATEVADYQAVIDPLKTAQDAFNNAKTSFDLQNTAENIAALNNARGEYFDM